MCYVYIICIHRCIYLIQDLLGANTKLLHANPSHGVPVLSSCVCDLGAVLWVRHVLKRGILELSTDSRGRG